MGLVTVMIVGGSILIPNMIAFGSNDDWFISFTGACSNEGFLRRVTSFSVRFLNTCFSSYSHTFLHML